MKAALAHVSCASPLPCCSCAHTRSCPLRPQPSCTCTRALVPVGPGDLEAQSDAAHARRSPHTPCPALCHAVRRVQDHLEGKQYLGWKAIRERYAELLAKYGAGARGEAGRDRGGQGEAAHQWGQRMCLA